MNPKQLPADKSLAENWQVELNYLRTRYLKREISLLLAIYDVNLSVPHSQPEVSN